MSVWPLFYRNLDQRSLRPTARLYSGLCLAFTHLGRVQPSYSLLLCFVPHVTAASWLPCILRVVEQPGIYSCILDTPNSTVDDIFVQSWQATVLELIAVVQSVRNTRLPTPAVNASTWHCRVCCWAPCYGVFAAQRACGYYAAPAPAAADRYFLRAGRSAANPPATDGTERRTDRQTDGHSTVS